MRKPPPPLKRVGYWKSTKDAPNPIASTATELTLAYLSKLSPKAAEALASLAVGITEADLLDPRTLVDANWHPLEKQLVLAHLKRGKVHQAWMGFSNCRFCGCENGTRDMSDGVYVWPEGFAHYLLVHHVRPPQEFVAHVLRQAKR